MVSAARTSVESGDWFDEHFIANCIGSQRLIRRYLAPEPTSWQVEGACITAKKVGNRKGVPKDATTWVYAVEGVGFVATVRAVWHRGDLMGPLKTHCRVIAVSPDDDDARAAYNRWLRSLAAI